MAVILPGNRPVMTREAIENLARPFGIQGGVYIVAVRGHFRDTMGQAGRNDLGIYDDAIWVISPTCFRSFNANTDPSVQRPGIASLCPGKHYYRKGRHGISHGPGYPALRPATDGERLPVMRDGHQDFGVAINIHRGGANTTSSEGCQTVHPSQWAEFIGMVYREMDRYGQAKLAYILTVKPDA